MKTKTKPVKLILTHHQWNNIVFKFLAAFLLVSLPSLADAQKTPTALNENNETIRRMAEKVDPSGFIFFNGETPLNDGDLFTNYKSAMGLGRDDTMEPVSTVTDQLGMTHVRYKQKYKGVPVDGGDYLIHLEDCIELLANGTIVENISTSTRAKIDERRALEIAMDATGAKEFAWLNEEWEADIKDVTEDSTATYFPKAEMVITGPVTSNPLERRNSYAFRFMIQLTEPANLMQVDVDATTGAVINSFNTTHECFKHDSAHVGCTHDHSGHSDHNHDNAPAFANGTAQTIYYGSQTIQTSKGFLGFGKYRLRDKTRGNHIITKDYSSNSNIKDSDNNWPSSQGKYTQAHWTAARSWDYFKFMHGLDGTDDSGKRVYVKSNWNIANANYSNQGSTQRINIGIVNGKHLSTMDIMAHEYTHGVIRHSANLTYQGESGALNESFADIFGTMAEDFANAGPFDWTMGEDASFTIRSLSNPPAHNHPDTYGGTHWINPSSSYDYGGVHINSGVQNKWFYLLAQGGTHNGVTIQGIGKSKAAKIAFRNLTVYLTAGSNFAAARTGAIKAAKDLYGACSNEVIQTTNAWAAVNVGNTFEGDCVKITGPYYVCVYGFNMLPVTFKASGLPGSSFTWSQIPSNWNVTIYGTGNKYLRLNSVSIPASFLPQTVNIKVTSSQGGSDYHSVTLDDCRIDPCEREMR